MTENAVAMPVMVIFVIMTVTMIMAVLVIMSTRSRIFFEQAFSASVFAVFSIIRMLKLGRQMLVSNVLVQLNYMQVCIFLLVTISSCFQ